MAISESLKYVAALAAFLLIAFSGVNPDDSLLLPELVCDHDSCGE